MKPLALIFFIFFSSFSFGQTSAKYKNLVELSLGGRSQIMQFMAPNGVVTGFSHYYNPALNYYPTAIVDSFIIFSLHTGTSVTLGQTKKLNSSSRLYDLTYGIMAGLRTKNLVTPLQVNMFYINHHYINFFNNHGIKESNRSTGNSVGIKVAPVLAYKKLELLPTFTISLNTIKSENAHGSAFIREYLRSKFGLLFMF